MERDWVVLNIDEQRMWVGLTIKEPVGEEQLDFSVEFVESYLRDNGIKTGICKEAIEALVTNVRYGQEVIVAEGKPPVNGRDGFYQYLIPLEDAKAKPVVKKDGTVDYHNSLKLAMVEEQQLFAVYVPPTPGEYGYTVFSEMLPPVRGKELQPLKGKGFLYDEETREYRAEFAGRIYRDDGRIFVDKVYVVRGDVDMEQGNIEFNGDVEIKGDVRSGFSIVAAGNIYVQGHVGACQITAGKNITIKKGVQGHNKCDIHAGGDVTCNFLERCNVIAGGDFYATSVLDCEVVARGRVIVTSKRGHILAGNTIGMQGIVAREVGNETGVITVLQTGVTRDYVRRVSELRVNKTKVESELGILEKNLKIYDGMPGERRTKETEALRMKILRAKVIKATELKHIEDEMNEIITEIENAKKDATVTVHGIAHSGVRIYMGRDAFPVREDCRGVQYRLVGTDIKASGIDTDE